MSFTLMLDEQLVADAHFCGEADGYTAAEQIEFWADLGKAIEAVMRPENVMALMNHASREALDERIKQAHTPAGRQQLAEYLAEQPLPPFEAVPDRHDLLVRIETDGTRTTGRLVDRQFVAV